MARIDHYMGRIFSKNVYGHLEIFIDGNVLISVDLPHISNSMKKKISTNLDHSQTKLYSFVSFNSGIASTIVAFRCCFFRRRKKKKSRR
jgi:hypothetical protein